MRWYAIAHSLFNAVWNLSLKVNWTIYKSHCTLVEYKAEQYNYYSKDEQRCFIISDYIVLQQKESDSSKLFYPMNIQF